MGSKASTSLSFVIVFHILFYGDLKAQAPDYLWPVATAPALSANFGELRSNHYHMGLDARTEQRENIGVIAVADGYISRIKIEPWGFGRAIYLNHGNGITSLYAHLNNFYPELEKWIKEQQYKAESWQIDIEVPQNLFSVKKGKVIAYSGNTGGSMGPHLHFELRDTKTEVVLNPLRHGFSVEDNIPPSILRLALYDRCVSTYEQSPKLIALKKTGSFYQPVSGDIIVNTDKVSFGITAYDRYTGSTNQNGIYSAVLFDNGDPVIGFAMDSISYDDTRYLNAHIDYKTKASGGSYLQHLSRLPGHTHSLYNINKTDGVVHLEGDETREIKIEVSDPEGNTSTIRFKIKTASVLKTASAVPDFKMFHPGFINVFENDEIKFHLSERSLYDSFRFRFNKLAPVNGQPVYQLHSPIVPVHQYFPVSIRAQIPAHLTEKIIMKRYWGTKSDFKKTVFSEGWFTGEFREFGNYQLVVDTIPPVISPVSRSATALSFRITDNTEEIQNFSAQINGKWVRFSNDKGRTFIYRFDENCPPGANELVITVEDLAGNKGTRSYKFTR